MSLYFFDASALVKYYILEPGSTWVRTLINPTEAQSKQSPYAIFIADISVTEVSAAFAILHRTGRIRRSTWDSVFAQFMYDVTSRYQLIRTDLDDFFTAATLTRQHPLKAYDAVQLAVAVRHNRTLADHELTLTFVSGDRTLLAATRAENIAAENPFDYASPLDTP